MSSFLIGVRVGKQPFLVRFENGEIVGVIPITEPPTETQAGGDSDSEVQSEIVQSEVQNEIPDWIDKAISPSDGEDDGKDGGGWGAGVNTGDIKVNKRFFETDPTKLDPVFKQQLMSVMTDNKYDRHLKGRKKGNIDHKSLWRVSTGATNVFTQKQSRKNKRYNIVLLIDESGSMHAAVSSRLATYYQLREHMPSDKASDKAELLRSHQAARTAVFLAKHLDNINIELAIVGFNRFIMIHKNFDEHLPDLEELYGIIVNNVRGGGGAENNDIDGLAMAYKLLRPRLGQQNIVIMISDGQPAPSRFIEDIRQGRYRHEELPVLTDSSGKKHTFWYDESIKLTSVQRGQDHHIRAYVHSNRHIAKTFGIGIDSNARQVPDSIRINDGSQLQAVVVDYLKKNIKRGV